MNNEKWKGTKMEKEKGAQAHSKGQTKRNIIKRKIGKAEIKKIKSKSKTQTKHKM